MNRRKTTQNKLVYLAAMFVLVLPMYYLGHPKTPDNAGGTLAQLQTEYSLAESSLGEIDPASETMKLATLGLRGLASQLLWHQSNKAKKEENWNQLTAVNEQLARLQPHYIKVWKFQSWNVSYNVSVQFDDYRDRYFYVREGINFLEEGINLNRDNADIPQLLWDMGWFIGQKIGRADEYVQYRRLFKQDDDFHGDRPVRERDNWLVSKQWYLDAIDSVDVRVKDLGKKSEKVFYSSPVKSQMSYAEAIEEEGDFVNGQPAWVKAEEEWVEFGEYPIEHSTGVVLQLGSEETYAKRVEELSAELDGLRPGTRDELKDQKLENLGVAEQVAYKTPPEERTQEQAEMAYQAEQKLGVSDREVAVAVAEKQPELKTRAFDLAVRLVDARRLLIYTKRYKTDSNYDYWLLRSQFEQTADAVSAREFMFDGDQAYKRGDRTKSKQLYEQGFAKWREVLDAFPDLMDPDGPTGEDVLYFVKDYRKVLNALDESFPEDFPLWDLIEIFDVEMKFDEELREHRLRTGGYDAGTDRPSNTEEPAEPGNESPATDAAEDGPTDDPSAEAVETVEDSSETAETEHVGETEADASAESTTETGSEED